MQVHRLKSGGLIDRQKPVHFKFNNLPLSGYEGDSLASALLANNINLIARSIKYHRPRGILSAGLEEPCALVACDDGRSVMIPNLKATEIRLKNNMVIQSQNCWPGPKFDLGALLQLGSSLLIAGFYYKTFMWPRQWWLGVYEKLIRHSAGQGRVSCQADTKLYDKRNVSCDTLVIGSGPSGIKAALAAVESDASVMLIEQDDRLGGSILWEKPDMDSHSTTAKLEQIPNLRCLINTLAFGHYDHGLILAVEHRNDSVEAIYWRIRARRVVFATGATEQPLVFADNDRPGIMLAASVRQYIYRYAVCPGKRAFLAIADAEECTLTREALLHAGIEIVGGTGDGDQIIGSSGWQRLRSVQLLDKYGQKKSVKCDLLCISSGWVPNAQLSAQLGDSSIFAAALQQRRLQQIKKVESHHPHQGKAFIDFQNDVTHRDLELAVQEGYQHIELAKRYTTLGMGTDQGKTSWPNAIDELAGLSGKKPDAIGLTSFRPPYSPISFGALAGAETGKHMLPTRCTPFHQAFEQAGCVFQASGNWAYSRYFRVGSESMAESILREAQAVRSAVGCVDMSTLGKVDVKGRDALEFLSRIYCNNIDNIRPGRLRYVLLLREDGIVYDDGTVSMLAENHFLVTMTTANAEQSWRWLNKLAQLHWPDLDVQLTSVTEHWASLAIAGPESRNLLADLQPDFKVDKTSFSFASVRQGILHKYIPCRVFSVSFSGELSYEINLPAGYAEQLFKLVMEYGAKYGITPYGLETLDLLRIEKGHLAVGTEIDGRTTAADLGLGKMVSTRKTFIGSSLLQRPALQQQNRLQLVGLKPADGCSTIPSGAHLTESAWRHGIHQQSQGRLTAAVESPTLGHSIALALLQNGQQRMGQKLWAVSPVNNCSVEVIVGTSCFYDREARRVHE